MTIYQFPNEEGQWKLLSTGETVKAVKMEDIQGYPLFAVFFDNENCPYFSVDFSKEDSFEKI